MKTGQEVRTGWRWAIACVLLLFVSGTFAQAPLVVEWNAGRLSVSADHTPLAQVLREVASRTGIEVHGLDRLRERVSVRFANLPLREGLDKILAHQDYAMLGDVSAQGGDQSATLVVLGQPAAAHREGTWPEGQAAEQVAPSSAEGMASESEPMAEPDPAERAAALHALPREGNADALRAALLDPDPGVQAIAFQGLAERDPHEAATLAVEASRSNELSRRLSGLFALGQLDDPIALPALEQSLTDGDDGVREYAVNGLSAQSSPEATLALTRALGDPSPVIRILALEALASRGGDGQEAVRSALQSGDPLLRARAAELLAHARGDDGN